MELLLRVPEHVAEDEAALGVGVLDLDRLAGGGAHDVARTLCVAVGHVLDQADETDHVGLRLAAGDRGHGADDGGRAAHVALHVLHAGARFQRDAARVEGDALAYQGNRGGLLVLGAHPFHHDEARAANGALAHAEQRAHAELGHRGDIEHFDLEAEFGQLLDAVGVAFRVEDVRRFADEVAGEFDAFGLGGERRVVGAGAGGAVGDDRDGGEGRFLFRLQRQAVLVESVAGETCAEGEVGGRAAIRRADDGERLGAAEQRALDQRCCGLLPPEVRCSGFLADADSEHA